MNFELPYTEEQERFRQEVRAWLDKNVPEEMKRPIDPEDSSTEQYWFWREKHKELAQKGWLYPTYPREYGGGGLTADHETVIDEEFARARALRGFSAQHVLNTLLVWGTEEQKQKFAVPCLKGEKVMWNKLTEPHSGADLADYRSRAVRDGDDWLITGQQVFISGREEPDMMGGPLLTDPDAPRHRNLGYFIIPVPSEGLVIQRMALLNGRDQHVIFFDKVRVPGNHIIGGDHQGWQVAGTHLEVEHGGLGQAAPRDVAMENLLSYVKETKRNGGSLGGDPLVQQESMAAYIDAHVNSLLLKRTFWMNQSRMVMKGENNVSNLYDRLADLRNSVRVREVMGMYALLGTREPGAPHGGAQEVDQRSAAGQRHPGGTTNIAKVVLARRIGISRTQERAAPMVTTATARQGS